MDARGELTRYVVPSADNIQTMVSFVHVEYVVRRHCIVPVIWAVF